MAAHPTVKTPFQTPSIIDLTQSDDEDKLPRIAPPNRHSQVFPHCPQNIPVSNHGRILPRKFNHIASPQLETKEYSGNHGPACRMYAQSPGINSIASRPQTSIRPHANTSSANADRGSTEQFSPNRASIARDRRNSVEANIAKRRKTNEGTVSQEPQIAVPYRALRAQDGNGAPKPTESHTPINAPSSILPTQSQTYTRAVETRIPPAVRPVTVPQRRVSVAGRLQADSSRISLKGCIKKPQNLPRRSASVVPKDQQDHLAHVLHSQVFKHISTALDQYRSSLGSKDRAEIGDDTVKELVKDPRFIEDYTANDSKLSARYERKLSIRAHAYVDKLASEILKAFRSKPRESWKENSPDDSDNVEVLPVGGGLQEDTGREAAFLTPSSGSDNDEEAFELPSEVVANVPPSRHYSSSPTTSFSIDANDRTSIMDLDSHEETNARSKAPKRRSSRQLRSKRPSELETMESVNARHPRQASKLEQAPSLPEKFDVSALREIHSLRLVAGDRNAQRPYLSFKDRENIRLGFEIADKFPGKFLSRADQDLLQHSVFHVDLCLEELEFLCKIIQAVRGDILSLSSDVRSQIITLMNGHESIIPEVISVFLGGIGLQGQELGGILLQKRSKLAIEAFLNDAVQGKIANVPQIARIDAVPRRKRAPAKPAISSLLRQREIDGLTPVRARRCQQPFKVEIASHLEDTLVRKSEWTDCCGDISTVTWTGPGTFICGATAHSDSHNMQYNKPGNLVVGSCSLDALRAVADHRIVRPVIERAENAENSLESMRRTQDPWLYTSVVSTSHSEASGFTFTASFDHTVKVWKVSHDGSSIDLRGTWRHDGKVNFVVTSEHHNRVATASDVIDDAIRVYNFDGEDIATTPYDTYCGEKALEQAKELRRRDTWVYFPATIQWGKALSVANLLLVGYSPRSVTTHEVDIPEEKKNSGELCLWNVENMARISISSARTQNVFEVMWHPTQPSFLAATSPCGIYELETRTQIRLFTQHELGSFLHVMALDCPAFDINELTIMPNSSIQCYVTASCTDGNTYVWDTAQGDRPIHTLGHGESLDNPIHDLPREIADTGVKFASWGKSADRFYTGSSDGKVKAWDIRKPKGHAFVRTVLSVSGSIAAGAFSKNFSKLLIGDATGKVHLLEIDDEDPDESPAEEPEWKLKPTNLRHQASAILAKGPNVVISHPDSSVVISTRKPKVIIAHPEPPLPAGFAFEANEDELTAQEMAHLYLNEGQLIVNPDRRIGAIQGPNYAETLLYRNEAHENNDGTLPLLPEWQAKQRYDVQSRTEELKLQCLPEVKSSDASLHTKNQSLEFNFSQLSLSTQQELKRDRIDLDFEPLQRFDYELTPRFEMFKKHKKRTHSI